MAPVVDEAWFKLEDGKEAWTKTYQAEGEAVANLMFLHGFSDHIDRYKDLLFPHLAAAGITVHAFDQRGWGRTVKSKGERGQTGSTVQVMADIAHFVRARTVKGMPNFLMGHSMGGQETAFFLATAPQDVRESLDGYVLSSPFIAFGSKMKPPRLEVIAGRFAAKLLPNMQLAQPMDESWMSHDPALNTDWKQDPLCHDTGTLEGLAGMVDRADQLDRRAVAVTDWDGLRVLLLHGDADVVCDAPGAQRWLEHAKLKNKEVRIFPGAYHCVFAEPDHKKEYLQAVIDFIKAGPKPAAVPAGDAAPAPTTTTTAATSAEPQEATNGAAAPAAAAATTETDTANGEAQAKL